MKGLSRQNWVVVVSLGYFYPLFQSQYCPGRNHSSTTHFHVTCTKNFLQTTFGLFHEELASLWARLMYIPPGSSIIGVSGNGYALNEYYVQNNFCQDNTKMILLIFMGWWPWSMTEIAIMFIQARMLPWPIESMEAGLLKPQRPVTISAHIFAVFHGWMNSSFLKLFLFRLF